MGKSTNFNFQKYAKNRYIPTHLLIVVYWLAAGRSFQILGV